MSKKSSFIPLAIILLIAFPQLNEAMYAIALPHIEEFFQLDRALLRYTLITYFMGFGLGTLLWGYISDFLGRKKTIISGVILCISGAVLYTVVNSLVGLLLVRFTQGLGISFASVIGQAIIRDLIPPQKRPMFFDRMNIILAFMPATGLILGLWIVKYYNWKGVFFLTISVSLVISILVSTFIPKIQNSRIKNNLYSQCFKQFIYDMHGLRLGFFVGASLGILYGYFFCSFYFFRNVFNISDKQFVVISFFLSVALFIGALISKKMKCTTSDKVFYGIIVQTIVSFMLIIFIKTKIINSSNQYGLLLSVLFLYTIVASTMIIIPNCLSRILNNYGQYIGTASSLYGFYYYIITAFFMSILYFLDIKSIEGLPSFIMIISLFLVLVLLVHSNNKIFRK